MNAVELKQVSKRYPGFRLENLTLALPGGCILGLIGENGAGKSTTIRLLLGLAQRDTGSIKLLGRDINDDLRLSKEDIGVVLDNVGIPSCLNARQVGKVMAGTYARWNQAQYEGYLRQLAIPENKAFKDFSRGMQMKLGIAIALSHDAKLLILDEATSGLDPVVRDEVVEMFRQFTQDENHSVLIGRKPFGADFVPHCQRFGKVVRLHCLPPQGKAAADGGKGPAAGGIRPGPVLPGGAGSAAGGGGEKLQVPSSTRESCC